MINKYTYYFEKVYMLRLRLYSMHRLSKELDWKRTVKLHNIRDTLYFEPYNFTLNAFQDFALT